MADGNRVIAFLPVSGAKPVGNLPILRFQLESFLEVEYETHFERFLMTTVRGSEKGSKKRYAGLIRDEGRQQLVFTGLEAVRSDWSPLAKEFQQELYLRVFLGEPFEGYIRLTSFSNSLA